jgi:hypothetical protein
MTFIISLIEKNYVFQVSDRRLTYLDRNSRPIKYTDDNNKAIFLNNRIAIAYTGLANIEGQRTDYWILDKLKDIKKDSISDCFSYLEDSLNKIDFVGFDLEIIATGWIKFNDSIDFEPIVYSISNSSSAKRIGDFTHRFQTLNKECFGFYTCGQRITPEQRKALLRIIRRKMVKGVKPEGVLSILFSFVSDLSNENRFIGSNLMGLCIPKQSVTKLPSLFLTAIQNTPLVILDDNSYFLYKTKNSGLVGYGPHMVSLGTALTDFECGPLNKTS